MVPFIRFYVDPLHLFLSIFLPRCQLLPTRVPGSLYNGNRESRMAIYASLVRRQSRPFASLPFCVSRGSHERARSFQLSKIWFIGWLARVRNLGNWDSQFDHTVEYLFSNTINPIRSQSTPFYFVPHLRAFCDTYMLLRGLTRTRGICWSLDLESRSKAQKYCISDYLFLL